jgi:diaminopimelate epimerase
MTIRLGMALFHRFDKYEGLGNDFVVVETADAFPAPEAVRLCDRHFGIGADGVLVVGPAAGASRARMIVINADGTRPEMCGNGLRCVALHLARVDRVERAEYVVDTDAGPRRCVVTRAGDAADVLIDMGRAEKIGEYRTTFEGKKYVFDRISVGNPHCICFEAAPDPMAVDRLGEDVSRSIPGGTNVEFVTERGPRAFDVVVWERGVGRTLACGTGAVATAAALALDGRAPFDEPLEIRLPGGPLSVTVGRALDVRMTGPARRVFGGELPAL